MARRRRLDDALRHKDSLGAGAIIARLLLAAIQLLGKSEIPYEPRDLPLFTATNLLESTQR